MTHKPKKPSKEELQRRRAKQKEVEARTGVKRGGAEIGTKAFERQEARRGDRDRDRDREPTPTRPEEPVRLGLPPTGEEDEFGRIVLNQAEEQIDPAEQRAKAVLGVTLAVGAGVVTGAGIFFAGSTIAAAFATRGITSAAAGVVGRTGFQTTLSGKVLPIIKSSGRFATNSKTIKSTAALLLKRGLQGAVVSFIIGAFGSYPFSAWARQEVLSGLKINARDARQAGDFETAEEMIAMRKEVHKITWEDFVPYANILEKFREFTIADKLAIISEERLLAEARGEIEFEGKSVGKQIEERDIERDIIFAEREEKSRQRDIEFKETEQERIERQEERDIEFEEAEEERELKQKARDLEFREREKERDIKFKKLREEEEERDREDTLFFEAIRKRNKGEKLTEAEKAILIKRGASIT